MDLFAVLCLFLFSGTLWAPVQNNVWHVGHIGGQPRDFSSVTEAIASSSVLDGDTLIISGDFGGESFTLSRPLHLVGYGYFHEENGLIHPPTTQVPAAVGNITVNASDTIRPDGGSITSLTIGVVTLADVDGFTVRRNNLAGVNITGGAVGPARGILIIQNYIRGYGAPSFNSGTWDNSNILVADNIFINVGYGLVSLSSEDSMVFMNNIFLAGLGLNGIGIFANNIVYGWVGTGQYRIANNLAIGGASLPEGDGNINSQNEADVFVLDASPDGKYTLKTGSPALAAGLDGADMGVYGGAYPYVVSGLPPIPVITNISAPLKVNDGDTLSVQVRAEVHP